MIAIQQTEEFESWLDSIPDQKAQGIIRDRLLRVEGGNLGSFKSVGAKVGEIVINYGPGYRVYFTKLGSALVVLLGGGTKRSQKRDIRKAQELAEALWSAK